MTEANCSACAQCGKTLERLCKRGPKRKFCGQDCYRKSEDGRARDERQRQRRKEGLKKHVWEFKCVHCGVAFHTAHKRTYCNKACVEQAKRLREGTKTFAEEIEARRQRSKFNFNCEHCGKAFYRLPGGQTIKNGSRTRWCSMRCKKDATVIRQEENRIPPFSKYFARMCVQCYKPFGTRNCRTEKCFECRHLPRICPIVERKPCATCGKKLVSSGRKFCSVDCYRKSEGFITSKAISRKAGKLKRRGAVVEHFDPILVLERDGWRCQICGVSTPKSRRGKQYHNSPELDHIRPISKGGEHSISNTQCACRACNGLKSNVLVIGQIGLFSADAIAKAGGRKIGVKKWEKVASA